MARIRTIKPEFCVSESLSECSVSARLLFACMWMYCDDYGNHPAKLMQLKAEVFPFDSFSKNDMADMVRQLMRAGVLVEYSGGNGATYWHVTNWNEHQLINRPSPGKFPPFSEEARITDDSLSVHGALSDDSGGKGKEGKGKERKGNKSARKPKPAASANPAAAAPLSPDGDGVCEKPVKKLSPQNFKAWWEVYPKKRAKGDAERVYPRAVNWLAADRELSIPDAEQLLLELTRGYRWPDDRQFIPYPATWLNQKRWDDQPDEPAEPRRESMEELAKRYGAVLAMPKPKASEQ